MTSSTCCLVLLVTMFAFSSAFNWIQVQDLQQGKTGYYSVGCSVDTTQVTSLGTTSAQQPVMCMNNCISRGGDVFDVSVSGCLCFKRDMSKAPRPFIDNVDSSPVSMQACGIIESDSTVRVATREFPRPVYGKRGLFCQKLTKALYFPCFFKLCNLFFY
jgi:hypothetical protein